MTFIACLFLACTLSPFPPRHLPEIADGQIKTLPPVHVATSVDRYTGDVPDLITRIATENGVGNAAPRLIQIAKCESGFNPSAKNPRSSASGIFQIIDGTWRSNGCVGNVFNAEDNVRCAIKIYQRRGTQPWVCR